MSNSNDEAMRREEERLQRHLNGSYRQRTVCSPSASPFFPPFLTRAPSAAGEKSPRRLAQNIADPTRSPHSQHSAPCHNPDPPAVCCSRASSCPCPCPCPCSSASRKGGGWQCVVQGGASPRKAVEQARGTAPAFVTSALLSPSLQSWGVCTLSSSNQACSPSVFSPSARERHSVQPHPLAVAVAVAVASCRPQTSGKRCASPAKCDAKEASCPCPCCCCPGAREAGAEQCRAQGRGSKGRAAQGVIRAVCCRCCSCSP